MSRRFTLSRRAFLGGAAAMIGLPYLEAMWPGGRNGAVLASEGPRATRLLYYYVPNGMHMASWTPATTGADFALTPILSPLAPVRDDISVLTNVSNRNAIDSVAGDHARGTGSFLTARLPRRSEGDDIENGISVDQVAASAVGGEDRFASLQLGMEGGLSIGSCDSGYSCAYSRNISWAGPATPLPKMTSPTVVFDRLFGGVDPELTQLEIARRRQYRRSVLDYAMDDAARLQTRLGATDRAKVDEYLTAVRELELRIDRLATDACGTDVTVPENWLVDIPAYSRIMNELMVLALQCEMTHVVSFMLGNGGSNRSYDFIGVSGFHHEISHHQNRPENFEKLEAIDTWEVEQLSHLLQRMKSVENPDGTTLLDDSLVFFSSEIEDGNAHRHTNLPIVLAGGGGGTIAQGRHLRFEPERPIADLFITMLGAVGVDVESFGGDGTAPIDELSP